MFCDLKDTKKQATHLQKLRSIAATKISSAVATAAAAEAEAAQISRSRPAISQTAISAQGFDETCALRFS